MFKRLREFFESIAFAGMKPSGPKSGDGELKWLGPLRAPVERFISGGQHSDPLYLSNRTAGQKLRSWALIGIPCLVLAAGVGITLSNLLNPPEAKPQKELTAKELGAKLLPNMDRDFKLASNHDIQVVEIAVRHDGGSRLTGIIHNSSSRPIESVEIVADLTDNAGSQVGGISGTIEKVAGNSNRVFSFPIKQRDAAFALVRDIISK